LLLAAYFLEAGLILVVAPWSAFWDRNFFANAAPVIEYLVASPYARGAVSGVGLVTVLAGLAELGGAFASRRSASTAPQGPTLPSNR
jgi:hypothetical protein